MSKKQKILKLIPEIVLFIVTISIGILYIFNARSKVIKTRYETYKDLALVSSKLISYDLLADLNALPEDTAKLSYKILKENLSYIIKNVEHSRFCYYYTLIDNKIVFLIDSEPSGSKDCSPAGQIFEEADKAYYKAYLEDSIIFTTYTKDRWGGWVSLFLPIHNPETGEIKAIFGIDFDAKQWNNSILKEILFSILLVSLITLLLLFILIAHSKNKLLKVELRHRKQIEQALRESEAKYRRISDKTTDVVWLLDYNGKSLFVTPSIENFTGYSVEEYMQQSISERFTKESAKLAKRTLEENVNIFKQTKNPKQVITIELEYICKTGGTKWGELLVSPYFDIDGSFIGYHGVTRDITKRRETEQELVKAKEKAEENNRLKSAFLSNMSHEIRTPMNGILGFAQLLKKQNLSVEKQNLYIDLIEKSGARMLNIINDIINISKIDAGQMTTYYSKTNISAICKNIYDFFLLEATQNKLDFRYKNNVSAEDDIVYTDNDKLYAILTNLIKNAIKFTPKGFVEFACEKDNDFLKFYVKDSGIGIKKERLEYIFERFWQEHIEHGLSNQGSGLGLAISKAYVELLGGEIHIESDENKGTKFTFTIKYHKFEQENENPSFTSTENKTKTRLKVLIAEDDEMAQTLLKTFLSESCESIITFNNGIELVEYCKSNSDIDLIFMDIKMPKLSGYEAVKQIREFNKDVVIIAQTAFAFNDEKEKIFELGCDDFITKPYSEELILDLLKKWFPR